MQKRRDRIERWRAERRKNELEATKKEGKTAMLANLQLPSKKWSLEEDDSDEEPPVMNRDMKNEENSKDENGEKDEVISDKKDEEDEIDPLDAFMAEVKQLNLKTAFI